MELEVSNENELPLAANKLIEFAGNRRCFLFDAPMGAGKTTFIKALCRTLGSTDNLSSPTYSIVNEYVYPGGKIFHFDLYRIKDASELMDLGIDEYIYSGAYCFFEWPEQVHEFLRGEECVAVGISVNENIRNFRAAILKL